MACADPQSICGPWMPWWLRDFLFMLGVYHVFIMYLWLRYWVFRNPMCLCLLCIMITLSTALTLMIPISTSSRHISLWPSCAAIMRALCPVWGQSRKRASQQVPTVKNTKVCFLRQEPNCSNNITMAHRRDWLETVENSNPMLRDSDVEYTMNCDVPMLRGVQGWEPEHHETSNAKKFNKHWYWILCPMCWKVICTSTKVNLSSCSATQRRPSWSQLSYFRSCMQWCVWLTCILQCALRSCTSTCQRYNTMCCEQSAFSVFVSFHIYACVTQAPPFL